ncbi:cold shock domain-containing protein [Streptomyces sp. NPDC005969]|uniref:cold-shock protein n=1 Tax=Streptomyces sp. NPDC005969 TaxID=3156722 RepID=UPI0033C98127
MVAGRVVRFDGNRGYGFIAPEAGGEDVFLHVNDLLIPESYLRPGLEVEFEVEEGDRGPKASSVRLAHGAEAPPAVPAPTRPAAAPSARNSATEDPTCDVLDAEEFSREVTELLLKAGPRLTAEQILEIRHELLKFAESHGWTED